eukprot:TRINITY_DN4860_c0_g1_i16.p1 TRINITY_DN4860_c0_g1~~TRINITY_DN4860_c0_g1_i16.p1  ORF type:complete len:3716 (+),score=852.66 TRINITY_DN4860_c0_g1_i16:125-11272(+)
MSETINLEDEIFKPPGDDDKKLNEEEIQRVRAEKDALLKMELPEESNIILNDEKEMENLKEDLKLITEAVEENYPIPETFHNYHLAVLLKGVLDLKKSNAKNIDSGKLDEKVNKMLLSLIDWALNVAPRHAKQIPPLIPELPEEVVGSFRDRCFGFMSKVVSESPKNGKSGQISSRNRDIYLQLFRASIGLPPQIDFLENETSRNENNTISNYLPYGSTAGMDNEFHPPPLHKNELSTMRAFLRLPEAEVQEKIAEYMSSLCPGVEQKVQAAEDSNKDFIFTKSTKCNVINLFRALQSKMPLLIEGDTGIGKTVSVGIASKIFNEKEEPIRFNLSSGTAIEDLVGRPQLQKGNLILSEQPFTKAFKEGSVLVLDECNLAQEDVLSTIESALDTGILIIPDPTNPARATKQIHRHENFRLIITQNPCSGLFRGKRHALSAAFLSRFFPLPLLPIPLSELSEIAKTILKRKIIEERKTDRTAISEEFWNSTSKAIVAVHEAATDFCIGHQASSLTVFSMRDIINVSLLLGSVSDDDADIKSTIRRRFSEAIWCLYRARFLQQDARDSVWTDIRSKMKGVVDIPDNPIEKWTSSQRVVKDGDKFVQRELQLPKIGKRIWCSENVAAPGHPIVVTKRLLNLWKQLDFVMELRRPVLVVGESGSGVSAAVLGYAAFRAKEFYLCHVTCETSTGNLMGQNMPCDNEERKSTGSIHKWIDGPATAAIDQGKWLLLDDLPAATATVLERLNSLLEENPSLCVPERTNGSTITGSDDFRVIATADPSQLGSLSPAFANRFTVVCFDPIDGVGCEEEVKTIMKYLLYAPPSLSWFNPRVDESSGLMKAIGNRIEHNTTEDDYANAIADIEIKEDFTFRVKVSGVNGCSVGLVVSNDVSKLKQPGQKGSKESLCFYSNHGKIIKSEAGNVQESEAERFTDGDAVEVSYSKDSGNVTFTLNDAVQKCIDIKGFVTEGTPLRPFVGLYERGSSAIIYQTTKTSTVGSVDEIADATEKSVCHIKEASSGCITSYGLSTVIKSIVTARRIAEDQSEPVRIDHLLQAYNITCLGSPDDVDASAVGRRASLQRKPSLCGKKLTNYLENRVIKKGANLPPSLSKACNHIVWSTGAEVSLLILDNHDWDIKNFMSSNCKRVTATMKSTLSEWLGILLPTASPSGGLDIKEFDGPLKESMNNGTVMIMEGIEALPASIQSQLLPLLDTGVLSRPGEGDPIRAMPGFCIAAICSSWEASRLPKKFASKFATVRLPQPNEDDYKWLLCNLKDFNIHKHIDDESAELIAGAAMKLHSHKMTSGSEYPISIRVFLSVCRRMEKLTSVVSNISQHALWAQCYCSVVLSPSQFYELPSLMKIFVECNLINEDESKKLIEAIKEAATYTQNNEFVTFTGWGLSCEVKGSTSKCAAVGGTKLQKLKYLIVCIAHSSECEETLLLTGPSSCKTVAFEEYTKMVDSVPGKCTVHLNCSTDESDLLGSVAPFTMLKYKEFINHDREILNTRTDLDKDSRDCWTECLKNKEDIFDDARKGCKKESELEGTTIFSFADGPLSHAAKKGRGILLKAANLPSESIFTSLMPLFVKRQLDVGVFSPEAPPVPLKPGTPMVLTVTCRDSDSQVIPPFLNTFTVKRITESYSEEELRLITKSLILKNDNPSDSEGREADAISDVILGTIKNNVRQIFRWAKFVNVYSEVAKDVTKRQALFIGAKYLMQNEEMISDDLLKEPKWTNDEVTKARGAVITPTIDYKRASMKGLIEPVADTSTIRLLGSVNGQTLAFTKCCDMKKLKENIKGCRMVPTTSLLSNLSRVFVSSVLGTPLLLEGDPGTGKSFIIESAAKLLSCNFTRIQFSAGTTLAYLFGSQVRNNEKKTFERTKGVLGEAIEKSSSSKESWILLDELNLAPTEIQQALAPMLSVDAEELPIPGTTEVLLLRNIKCFAAVNPAKVGGGRQKLPPSLRDLFSVVRLKDGHAEVTTDDSLHIAKQMMVAELDIDSKSELFKSLNKIIKEVHSGVQQLCDDKKVGTSTRIVNLRTLEKVILLLSSRLGKGSSSIKLDANNESDTDTIKEFVMQVLDVVYRWKFSDESERKTVNRILNREAKSWGVTTYGQVPEIKAMGFGNTITFGKVALPRGSSKSSSTPLPPSNELRGRLCTLAAASVSSLAVLLEGPTASGKTSLVREFARICGQTLQLIPVTPNTEIGELLGMWIPWKGNSGKGKRNIEPLAWEIAKLVSLFATSSSVTNPANKDNIDHSYIKEIRSELERHLKVLVKYKKGSHDVEMLEESTQKLCDKLRCGTDKLRGEADKQLHESFKIRAKMLSELLQQQNADEVGFHFAESQLMHAMQEGDWVLLDNIDWAPSATVERLNPLLEANATFKLDERGSDEPVLRKGLGIHPNFRMFFTSNPARKHASVLSSAFHNRVIALSMSTIEKVGEGDCVSNMLFASFNPRADQMASWQYLAGNFHKRCQEIDNKISIRTLQHCLSRWKMALRSSAAGSSLYLLCGILVRAYTKSMSDKHKETVISILREVLTRTQALTFPEVEEKKEEVPEPESTPLEEEPKEEHVAPQLPAPTMPEPEPVAMPGGDEEIERNFNDEQPVIEEREVEGFCLAHLKSERLSENEASENCISTDEPSLIKFAHDIEDMLSQKGGNIFQELLTNLKFPEGLDPVDHLASLCNQNKEVCEQHYKGLTEIHLLVLKIYTMEWNHIDYFLKWQDAVKFETEFLRLPDTDPRKAPFVAYKKKYKKDPGNGVFQYERNVDVYREVNAALRNAFSDDPTVRYNAKVTQRKWIHFIFVLISLCDDVDDCTLYRKITSISDKAMDHFRNLKKGDAEAYPAATSASRIDSDDFLGKKGSKDNVSVIFKGIKRGFRAQFASNFEDEKEVLIPPFSVFEVLSNETVTRNDREIVEIVLQSKSILFWDNPSFHSSVHRVIHNTRSLCRFLSSWDQSGSGCKGKICPLDDKVAVPHGLFSKLKDNGKETIPDSAAATVEFFGHNADCDFNANTDEVPIAASYLSQYQNKDAVRQGIKNIVGKPVLSFFNEPCEATAETLQSFFTKNVFTRYEAASTGVELYIPGLIRAFTTGFSYNKIFASKTAGGARSHSCIILFDVGVYLRDEDHFPVLLGIFAKLRSSIASIDINPTVLVYGHSNIYCVSVDTPWDDVSIYAFLAHIDKIRTEGIQSCMPLNPLHNATSMLMEMKEKKKTVFIITDGNGISKLQPEVADSLSFAELNGIDVIGIGFNQDIHFAIPRAVSVSDPKLLSQGLEALIQGSWKLPESKGADALTKKNDFWSDYSKEMVVDGNVITLTIPAQEGDPKEYTATIAESANTAGDGITWTIIDQSNDCDGVKLSFSMTVAGKIDKERRLVCDAVAGAKYTISALKTAFQVKREPDQVFDEIPTNYPCNLVVGLLSSEQKTVKLKAEFDKSITGEKDGDGDGEGEVEGKRKQLIPDLSPKQVTVDRSQLEEGVYNCSCSGGGEITLQWNVVKDDPDSEGIAYVIESDSPFSPELLNGSETKWMAVVFNSGDRSARVYWEQEGMEQVELKAPSALIQLQEGLIVRFAPSSEFYYSAPSLEGTKWMNLKDGMKAKSAPYYCRLFYESSEGLAFGFAGSGVPLENDEPIAAIDTVLESSEACIYSTHGLISNVENWHAPRLRDSSSSIGMLIKDSSNIVFDNGPGTRRTAVKCPMELNGSAVVSVMYPEAAAVGVSFVWMSCLNV